MALITSAQSGNFNNVATWTGGVIPGVADEARASTGHTITITENATCNEVSNTGSGTFILNAGVTLTANVTHKSTTANTTLLTFSAAFPNTANIVGNITGGTANPSSAVGVTNTGTLSITGQVSGGGSGNAHAVSVTSSGAVIIVGECRATNGNFSCAVNNTGGGTITITGDVTGGANGNNSTAINVATNSGFVSVTGHIRGATVTSSQGALMNSTAGATTIVGNVTAQNSPGVVNSGTGTLTISGGAYTASPSYNAVVSTNVNSIVRASGSFIYALNGFVPVNAPRFILNTTPSNALTRYSLNGTGSYVDMFTADNGLNQASPADVRAGVSYASGNLTGRLTVPARGSVALSVNYGPSMPFTALRSGTTATATLAYSYPYQVGDQITITGASESDWNGSYTIASVVSGTSITFAVPSSLPATAGTNALMQTTGTAVLDPASVASAVWGAATRTLTADLGPTAVEIRQELDSNSTKLANLDATVSSRLAPSGTLATVTTLTNAPTVPSPSAIATQVRSELTTELGRIDAAISTRATPANIPAADITAIKAKTDALNTTRLAQVATTEIVGGLLAQANS